MFFRPTQNIIIRQPDGIVDGKPHYAEIVARGRLIDFSQRDLDYFGNIQDGRIILVAPPTIPVLPGQIRVNDELFELVRVKICRDLDGVLIGCRCAVVGG